MMFFFERRVSSLPFGTWYFTFGVTVRMCVTIIKKKRTVNIRSGSDAVFSIGTSGLRCRLICMLRSSFLIVYFDYALRATASHIIAFVLIATTVNAAEMFDCHVVAHHGIGGGNLIL